MFSSLPLVLEVPEEKGALHYAPGR